MARIGGNPTLKGNKNSGRKSIKEEIEAAKELITQDALIKLANSKVYKQLIALKDFKNTKEMALPITLKGIIEKKDITSGGKPIPILGGITQNGIHQNDSIGKAVETDKAD